MRLNIENSSKKVAVYGNLIVDNVREFGIINCTKEYKAVGAVGNVCSFIKQLNSEVKLFAAGLVGADYNGDYIINTLHHNGVNVDGILQIESATTSRADIHINLRDMSKAVEVNWGACVDAEPDPIDADWHHFAYLDKLDNISKDTLRKCGESGIVSADLCLPEHTVSDFRKVMDLLTEVDYLIVSDEEVFGLFGGIGVEQIGMTIAKVVKAGVIIRTKAGSLYFSKDEQVHEHSHKILSTRKGNILGAGDFFVSSFIVNSLHTENTVVENISMAHCDATRFVVND